MASNLSRSNGLGIGRGAPTLSVAAASIVFLLVPLGVLIFYSFNTGKVINQWAGFSLHWYSDVLRDRALLFSVRNSLTVAFFSTIIATVLGTMIALAIGSMRGRNAKLFYNLLYVPVILPEIIFGVALLALFVLIGFPLGLTTVCIAHVTFTLPFVALIVIARVQTLDPALSEASMDLGATRWQTLRLVILPALAPAIVAGALFAFTGSIDDLVATFFTAGVGASTMPLRIYALLKTEMTPLLNALSTMLIILTVAAVSAASLLQGTGRTRRTGAVLAALLVMGVLLLFAFTGTTIDRDRVVHIWSWSNYIAPDVIAAFEREHDMTVTYDFLNDNEEMLAKLQSGAGGYDIIIPSGYMVEILKRENLIRPIGNVPNRALLDTAFTNLEYDTSGRYYIPYTYGCSGYGYDTRVITTRPDTLGIMWDERHRGRLLMLDDPFETLFAGYVRLGLDWTLRRPADLAAAVAELRRQKPLLKKYDSNFYKEMLAAGEVDIVHCWNGTIYKLRREQGADAHVDFFVPQEGALFFNDNFAIPRDAQHPENAEQFINFMLRPDMTARNITVTGYAMPNPAAIALLPPEVADNPYIFVPREQLDRCRLLPDFGEFNHQMLEAWTRLKAE